MYDSLQSPRQLRRKVSIPLCAIAVQMSVEDNKLHKIYAINYILFNGNIQITVYLIIFGALLKNITNIYVIINGV